MVIERFAAINVSVDNQMSIPFTQYHLPNGRETDEIIDRSPEVEFIASAFIDRTNYECEVFYRRSRLDGSQGRTANGRGGHRLHQRPDIPARLTSCQTVHRLHQEGKRHAPRMDVRKVARLKQLIERQIQLRVEQLATFVQLKKAIDHRMFRGQLLQSDIKDIEDKLKQMPGSSDEAATDHAAIEAIQHLLDGKEWSSDTLSEIARIVKNAGYQVRDHRVGISQYCRSGSGTLSQQAVKHEQALPRLRRSHWPASSNRLRRGTLSALRPAGTRLPALQCRGPAAAAMGWALAWRRRLRTLGLLRPWPAQFSRSESPRHRMHLERRGAALGTPTMSHTRVDEIYDQLNHLTELKSFYDGSRSFGHGYNEEKLRDIERQECVLLAELDFIERGLRP